MRIGVFGFYHALNAGDDRIQQSIVRIIGTEHHLVFLRHDDPPPAKLLREYDWLLIGGGGLVFDRYGIWVNMRKWMRKARASVGVIGLGVNHLPPPLDDEVRALLDRASFFFVRDRESHRMLRENPRAVIGPDLTWSFPYRKSASEDHAIALSINLAPCWWKPFDPAAWVAELDGIQCQPLPLRFSPKQDYDLLLPYFGQRVPHEFEPEQMRRSQIIVASRFHAIVFAMQMRIPFVAISYDDKVRRLVDDAQLSEFCLDTHEHARLRPTIERLVSQKSAVVDRIDRYAVDQEKAAAEMVRDIRTAMGIQTPDSADVTAST